MTVTEQPTPAVATLTADDLARQLIVATIKEHTPIQGPDVHLFAKAVLCHSKDYYSGEARELKKKSPDAGYGCVEHKKDVNAMEIIANVANDVAEHKPGRGGIKFWQLRQ